MNISPYTKWPELKLEPLNFDFLLKAQAYQDQKVDAGLKTLDETTGLLAALNPAPGNEKWAKDVAGRYNTMLGQVANDVGKVPIQQTISDARRIKADFLNNTDVKTILNNREYYEKILAPYMANKEAQLNVPGGTMSQYMEPGINGGYNFKQNKASYSGTLSYQPYADFNKRNFETLEKVVGRIIPKDSNGNYVPTTTDDHGNLYWVENNERHYIKDAPAFQTAIDGMSNTILTQSDPESRWFKADLEFHGQGDKFNKEYISNHLLDLSKPLWGEKLEGSEQVHPISTNDDSPDKNATSSPVSPSYLVGETQTNIIPQSEIETSRQADVASSYKTSDFVTNKNFINNHLNELKTSLPSLANETPESLKITRESPSSSSNGQVSYKIGVTEDEYVSKFPDNQKSLAKANYKLMVNSFNNQAIQEQHLANLHTQAVEAVKQQVLGDPKTDPNAKAMYNYIDAVENFATAPESTRKSIRGQARDLIDGYAERLATTTFSDSQGIPHEYVDDNKYEKEYNRIYNSIESGIIPQDFKGRLYDDMGTKFSAYSPLKTLSENPNLISDKYTELYNQDQIKNYNVVTFAPEGVESSKWSDLHRYQVTLAKGLEATQEMVKGKMAAAGTRGATYYVVGTLGREGVPSGEYNSTQLFGPNGTVAQSSGVKTQGFIYDKENGWFLKGTLQGTNGEEVLVKVPGMDERIISDLTANPDASHFTTVVGTLLNAMPKTDSGIPILESSKDPKLETIFSKFGMNDVFITGTEAAGYHISFKPTEEVASKMAPGILDNQGYYSKDFGNLIELGNFTSKYTNSFGSGKK